MHEFAIARFAAPIEPVSEMVNCIRLIQGVKAVLRICWPALARTDLAPLVNQGMPRGAGGEVLGILALKDLVATESSADGNDVQLACLGAIEALHVAYLEVALKSDQLFPDTSLTFSWPAKSSKDYISLLALKHPVAMIILAHFAVLLHLKKKFWWIGDWGCTIIRGVDAALAMDLRMWLLWPKKMTNMLGAEGNDMRFPSK